MKITVVMSTYNGCMFLKEQLMSIREQTYPVDEVIIFDDASKDNTVDFLHEFIYTNKLNSSWHVFPQQHNKGYILSFTEALTASITLEISPPEATFPNDCRSSPGFTEIKKSISSNPVLVSCLSFSERQFT